MPSSTSPVQISHLALLVCCIIIIIIIIIIINRPRRSRSAAAYSSQTFPWTICRSVRLSVCPVHCGKTADRIRMPFGIIGRSGPWMRQIVGFGDRSTGRGTFGGNFGRAIVTNGDFTAYVCDSAATRPSSQITLGRLVFIVFQFLPRDAMLALSLIHI